MSNIKICVIDKLNANEVLYEFEVPTVEDAPTQGDRIRVGAGMAQVIGYVIEPADEKLDIPTIVNVIVDSSSRVGGNG